MYNCSANMNKINVSLYGGKSIFGGREIPLEAESISCDKCNSCSLYAAGKCLRCRSVFRSTCIYGQTTLVLGCTSRAKKYHSFKNEYESDPVYDALKYPSNRMAVIGDYIWLNLDYVLVKEELNGSYLVTNAGLSHYGSFIKRTALTVKLLKEILQMEPRTILDGAIIQEYKNVIVPDVVQELKKLVPELHKKLITKYPEYDIAPNYIGKTAFIKTMVNGSVLKDDDGNEFLLKDSKLICDNCKICFMPFKAKTAKMEIAVTDSMTYKITDNSQCDDNTVFD